MQEAALTLALLYSRKYPHNIFYKKDKIKNWSISAMQFWGKIQDKDGSFSEWYPNEHSFVATAFTTYAISETYLLLENEIPAEIREEIKECLVKSGNWLCKHNERLVSNQQAGAVCALYNIYQLTGNKFYYEKSKEKLDIAFSSQSEEGWFPEYGGPDIGYLSVLIDYLAKYYLKTGDKRLKDSLERAVEFIKYFVHPNHSAGGEYASRNTEYLLPHGFEILAKENSTAKNIANNILMNIEENNLNLDDRYLCLNGYTYLQAYDDYQERSPSIDLPFKESFKTYFKEAGLYIVSSAWYYSIVGLSKGAVIKIYNKKNGKLLYDDCGITGQLSNKKQVTTQWIDKTYSQKCSEKGVSVSGWFHEINYNMPSTITMIVARLIQNTIGRSDKFSNSIKNYFRKKMIIKSKPVGVKFYRNILFGENDITVSDRITLEKKNISFDKLTIGGKFSLIYIPSTKYFQCHELESEGYSVTKKELQKLNRDKTLVVSRTITRPSHN